MKIPPAWKDEGKRLGKIALKGLVNNWWYKLLALLLAVVLWSGLISQDPSLTREKSFTDVTINLVNSEAIKRNGFIVVTDMTDMLKNAASIDVDVPQMQYDIAQASHYNVRVDLSKINQTGVQEVKVTATNSATYGTVTSISPATLEIEVEDYVTRYRIPVSVTVVGEAPEGYYAGNPTLDPPLVAVSGPRSLVEKITQAKATVDLSTLPAQEGMVRTAVPFTLIDRNGEAVESNLLEVTSESVLLDSVVIEQQVYAVKTIHLDDLGLITGTPAEGYEVKSVSITPDVIDVAASAATLEELDSIYPEGSVNVSGLSESFTQQIRVRKPSEVVRLSSDSVTVAVEIGPVIVSRTFEEVKIQTSGTGDGLRASLENKYADVTATGPQLWIEKLRASDLTLTCLLDGLEAGEYALPITCQIDGGEQENVSVEITPAMVNVTIQEK